MPLNAVEQKLANAAVNGLISCGIADGRLDPRGKSDKQFQREVLRYMKSVSEGAPLQFTTDFRKGLLLQARTLHKNRREEEAVLYYATWIEHMLNMMAASILRRRGLAQTLIREFIFDTGIRAKYLFVILQLCKRPPSTVHLKAISKLSSRRNEFVHFKWIYYPEDKWEKQDVKYRQALSKAEAVVRHLHYLEHRYIRFRLPKRMRTA
jgi:hypothetical protein